MWIEEFRQYTVKASPGSRAGRMSLCRDSLQKPLIRRQNCMLQADPAQLFTTSTELLSSQTFSCPAATDGDTRALALAMHESQQIAAERRDLAAHAHTTGAEHHGKEDHLTGNESSRQGREHNNSAYLVAQKENQGPGTGQSADGIAHEAKQHQIAALAYKLWQDRSCPDGSPEHDWFRAEEALHPRD